MRDDDALNVLGILETGVAKPSGQVPRKHLIVSPIDQDDVPVRRFDHRAVALLGIDEIDLQDPILRQRSDKTGDLNAG